MWFGLAMRRVKLGIIRVTGTGKVIYSMMPAGV